MAKKAAGRKSKASDDFTADLIKSLNKDHGSRIAYNLSVDESPTHVRLGCPQASDSWITLLLIVREADFLVAGS